MERMDNTQIFFQSVFGEKPPHTAIQVWIKTVKPVTWFLSDLDAAARVATQQAQQFDVYVGCGLGAQAHEKPLRTRLRADEVAGIPGVWADIDINGGPEDKTGAAADLNKAVGLANFILKPSLIVNSGYGIQAWWLFETPWLFESVGERVRAERMVRGFQAALQAEARKRGFRIDATHDLSRILRIPGTLNHKGDSPEPVTILECEGNRYQLEEISERCEIVGETAVVASEASVNVGSNVSLDNRVMTLVMEEPDFEALWKMNSNARIVKRLRDSSPSGVEFEISRWLAKAGLDAQQICDALVAWRNRLEPGDPRGKLRADRLGQTISRAIASVATELEKDIISQEQEEALQELSHAAIGMVHHTEQQLLAKFNRVIRGPKIKKFRQFSRDPATARFVIELEDGREVLLGAFGNITHQGTFREAYGVATGHYPVHIRKTADQPGWDEAVQALLKAAVVVDDVEDSTEGETIIWVQEYMDMVSSNDRDSACESNRPFVEDNGYFIPLRDFMRFLRRMGERVNASDVTARLRAIGYQRRTINFEDRNEHKSSRSYFTNALPKPVGRPSNVSSVARITGQGAASKPDTY